jgi:two-component system phosphate regulon sensor histidine kinase PhoR
LKKPIANIGILLLLIIVLPPLFFTSYEIGNFYQNEQMIDSIYTSQLESVLFSINQYSDDVVSGWANKLEQELQKNDTEVDEALYAFIQRNVSVENVLLTDSLMIRKFYTKDTAAFNRAELNQSFKLILKANELLTRRLIEYMEAEYRKIQPIDIKQSNLSLFLFAYRQANDKTGICGIVVNTKSFIREKLGPKIQAVAQDKFFLSVFETDADLEVYSNELYDNTDKNIEHRKPLWLMPDYELGIQLKGETIEDMVRQRMFSSIWLIIIIDLILILAAYFVYRGVRQQMKLAQLKSEFVSNVSHEIRTPLAIINMYSEALEMGRVKDEAKKVEYYKIINNETNRLSGIVNKILNFSKIESGKRDYKFHKSDLNQVIETIIQNYQHHFRNKGVSCSFSPAINLPDILMDPDAITDAVINLLDNAIKYSGDNKQIDIHTGKDGTDVYMEVRDYGIGIEEKYQKMVFDKFFRVTQGDLAHKAKGSGIGLSIVHHIMMAHEGKVTLVSKVGEGSRFRLSFPMQKT